MLLSSGQPGVVGVSGNRWSVTNCFASRCGASVALSYNGNESECLCGDTYSLRPYVLNQDWGGINVTSSCGAASQWMKLQFNSGVSISASGPTTLCEDGAVVLTANAEVCSPPTGYLWSNGETTASITVTEPGDYYVTVTGAGECTAISETLTIRTTDVSVTAGDDAVYCQEPVQLTAIGSSTTGAGGSMVNNICMYNSPGGFVEDCEFTTDVCSEGATFVGASVYSSSVTLSNPVELRYHIYYSAFRTATFRVKLNNQELGVANEANTTASCETQGAGQFPRSFVFGETDFKRYWIEGGANELTVQIETADGGIYLSGITAEVVTSNESYSWSPLAGLSNASIRQPLATPLVTTTYIVTYTDANNCSATDTVEVVVNDAPVIASVQASSTSVPVGTAVTLTTTYSDDDGKTATIDWGDLSAPDVLSSPSLTFQASHAYSSPGTYNVTVTVTDNCNKTAVFTYESITVFQNRNGSVNGGGWFDSPRGAYRRDLRASGRANFRFDAKYQSGIDAPQGSLTFNFHAGKFKFRSSQYQSLMINGETAVLTGSGSLNNSPGYNILIAMVDDDTKDKLTAVKKGPKSNDKIRVRITDPSGAVIYDTQLGEADDAIASTRIGAGQIEINNSGSTFENMLEDQINSFFAQESTSVYPNPFTDFLNVQFNAASNEDVVIQLMELTGKVIASAVYPVSEGGYYSLDISEETKDGIYLLTIRQGRRVEVLRLVRN
jgi:flagellar hook assembly protein FlgD